MSDHKLNEVLRELADIKRELAEIKKGTVVLPQPYAVPYPVPVAPYIPWAPVYPVHPGWRLAPDYPRAVPYWTSGYCVSNPPATQPSLTYTITTGSVEA